MANGQQGTPAVVMPQLPAMGVFAPQKGNVDYFVYDFKVASIAAAATASPTINISADSDFYWNATTFQTDVAGAAIDWSTNPIPLVTLQLQDQGSNRTLFYEPLPLNAVAGVGELPYRLVHPRLFTRATTITASLVNYSAATTYTNLYICLHGFKVYSLG